jgi:hypothetical protein
LCGESAAKPIGLQTIAPAAGATSPNKSDDGMLGEFITSAIQWEHGFKIAYFLVTGAIHGTLMALVGLIGDLTASNEERCWTERLDGDLILAHSGILDRCPQLCVDSNIQLAGVGLSHSRHALEGYSALQPFSRGLRVVAILALLKPAQSDLPSSCFFAETVEIRLGFTCLPAPDTTSPPTVLPSTSSDDFLSFRHN